MDCLTLTVGQLGTNCYLVWGTERRAAVIDPGDEAERILVEAASRGLTIEAILLTHLHIDHYLALPALLQATDARFVLPKDEVAALDDPSRNLMTWLRPADRFSLPQPSGTVGEGDTVSVGDVTFTVWHTPGHTAGSCCYLCGNTLFCGDTLFHRSIGRCDLPSGDSAVMSETLARFSAVTDDLRLLPGHGEETTLFYEQQYNPYIK